MALLNGFATSCTSTSRIVRNQNHKTFSFQYTLLFLILCWIEDRCFVKGWFISRYHFDFSEKCVNIFRAGSGRQWCPHLVLLLSSSSPNQEDHAVDGLKQPGKKKENSRKYQSLENDIQSRYSLAKDSTTSGFSCRNPSGPATRLETSSIQPNNETSKRPRRISYTTDENFKRQYSTKNDRAGGTLHSTDVRSSKTQPRSSRTHQAETKRQSIQPNPIANQNVSNVPRYPKTTNATKSNTRWKGENFKARRTAVIKNSSSHGKDLPSYSSMLPPPLIELRSSANNDTIDELDNPLENGLSSWEEFLGGNKRTREGGEKVAKTDQTINFGSSSNQQLSPISKIDSSQKQIGQNISKVKADSSQNKSIGSKSITEKIDSIELVDNITSNRQQRLPSIQDLFPIDLSRTYLDKKLQFGSKDSNPSNGKIEPNTDCSSPPSLALDSWPVMSNFSKSAKSPLDGISPVSDLFYRSSQAQNQESAEGDDDDHDDEELPFSAEQSDAVSSDQNKIRIRRNMVQQQTAPIPGKEGNLYWPQDSPRKGTNVQTNKGNRGRKMVRRGLEMLVGGVPINADPPQRCLELFYDAQQNFDQDPSYCNWAAAISLNSRDFGPLLHSSSIPKVSKFERGLFCEHICEACIKWNICPDDLKLIINSYRRNEMGGMPDLSVSQAVSSVSKNQSVHAQAMLAKQKTMNVNETPPPLNEESASIPSRRTKTKGVSNRVLSKSESSSSDSLLDYYMTGGEFSFDIGVSREELQSGDDGSNCGIIKSVFVRAFKSVLERAIHTYKEGRTEDFLVKIPSLDLTETNDGYTSMAAEFIIEAGFVTDLADMEKRSKRISALFTQAMDDGDMALAIAAAAKEETRWPKSVRDKVVEECLFRDDEDDELVDSQDILVGSHAAQNADNNEQGLHENENSVSDYSTTSMADLFHGGGVDGVFYDCSAISAANSPYCGNIGLRLVDSVVERAKQNAPKVIAVGDVHGCLDELQDLLRQCDYHPGDLVIFLGDLVCKGPDSISVVQLAREIGAVGVRGNHDFEVIRWHQAIKSGVDPPVVGSEHFHIASCLSKADMKWMYNLPWYISSKELECLFVHAGFVSGIRLAKQNPRLMMNMRSILPDGTVTSKFFNNWPWARLWDGPQTVIFGHDADRGLQQYEHALGLDTGCVYGGRLTACILPEKRLVSVSSRREYFKYRRKHYD